MTRHNTPEADLQRPVVQALRFALPRTARWSASGCAKLRYLPVQRRSDCAEGFVPQGKDGGVRLSAAGRGSGIASGSDPRADSHSR